MTKAIAVRAAAQIGGTSVLALTPACLSPEAVQTQQILAWRCSTAPLAKFIALLASASDPRRRGDRFHPGADSFGTSTLRSGRFRPTGAPLNHVA